MLIERQAPLNQLAADYEEAAATSGRAVLISGEAGIGKTSLIDEFIASLADETPVHRGGCEALFAARPLGPLFDIAEQLDGKLLQMLQSGADNHRIYSAFLQFLESAASSGAVLVMEDVHWADNATLDFLKFLGRRIDQCHCLLLVSYRDDEVGSGHPLTFVLGDLPANSTRRIELAPLSQRAIADLGNCDPRRAREILDITEGNPFFVHEILSSSSPGVPRSISDAILAKAARLSPVARRLLDLVSVVPGKCEIRILEAAFDDALERLDECAERGLLHVDRDYARFRHELGRLAIEDALPAGQRSRWNAHVLHELKANTPSAHARIAHHADMSGNGAAVLESAPAAAAEATRLGAHREAVALYHRALGYGDMVDDSRRADLLEHLAYELYVTGRIEDAIDTRKRCLALWESMGDEEGVARSNRWLSRLNWFTGRRDEADTYADRALAASAGLADSNEYAMACSNRAQLYMLSSDVAQAVEWAEKAIALARGNNDEDTLAHALNNLGTALYSVSADDGSAHLEQSLSLSLQNDFQEHAARAYTNLSSNAVTFRRYAHARGYLDAGISYTADRDLDSWLYYMLGWRALLRLDTGDWAGAWDDAMTVTRNYRGAPLVSSPALTARAWLMLRRGDAEFDAALEDAANAVARTREVRRFAPLVSMRAEQAWLANTGTADTDELADTLAWAHRLGQAWIVGDLSWWLRRLGVDAEPPGDLPQPYELLLRQHDWAAAALAWRDLGCPYEQALALAEGDEEARVRALRLFDELGAGPAAARLRRDLRASGVRGLPQKARQSTRSNPAGLTNRQVAVLHALCDGLSDAEIGARLFISPRTVSHHVSAILGKLDVRSRTEAAAVARDLGIDAEN